MDKLSDDNKIGTVTEEANIQTLIPRQLGATCSTKTGLATTTPDRKTWQCGAEKLENDKPHGNSSRRLKMQ